jgi:phosphonate transport system permease protein
MRSGLAVELAVPALDRAPDRVPVRVPRVQSPPRDVPDGSVRRFRIRYRWVGIVAVVFAILATGVGRRPIVNPGGWPLVAKFWRAALHPTLRSSYLAQTGRALITTTSYAILGTALSLGFGVVGGVLLSQRAWSRTIRSGRAALVTHVLRVVLAVPRGVHEAVWALLLLSVLGRDPIVAVLAIGIPYGAITAKVYADILDESVSRQHRGLRASGAGRLQSLLYGTLPASAPELVSYAFYRFECAVRAAVVLGMVGAGGIGFQLSQSFQGLAYREMWTSLYALIAIGALAEWVSARVRRTALTACGPVDRSALATALGRARPMRATLVAGALMAIAAWWYLAPSLSMLWSDRTRQRINRWVGESLPPKLPRGGWRELGQAAAATLHVSFLAVIGATLVAIPLALLAARSGRPPRSTVSAVSAGLAPSTGFALSAGSGKLRRTAHAVRAGERETMRLRKGLVGDAQLRRVARGAARLLALVSRSIPPTVWALLALFVILPGAVPGAVALGIYTAGVLARLFSESLENADPAPRSVLAAAGAPSVAATAYGLMPVVAPRWAAFTLYRWEVAARDAAVVGVVGAGGLGRLLAEQTAGFAFPRMTTTVLALIAVTMVVDTISSLLRRHLR